TRSQLDSTEDAPRPSTPGESSGRRGRPRRVDDAPGPADLPPPPQLGDFLQAFPGLVQAFQQQGQAQAALFARLEGGDPQDRARGVPMMEQFRRMGPPSFSGEGAPSVAESWIRETEKIFRAIRCPEEDRVPLASFMLQDRADVWWNSTLRTDFLGREDVRWPEFLVAFRRRFFPAHV